MSITAKDEKEEASKKKTGHNSHNSNSTRQIGVSWTHKLNSDPVGSLVLSGHKTSGSCQIPIPVGITKLTDPVGS